MRWRAALGIAALLVAAIGAFAVLLLTAYPQLRPIDPITSRVIAGFDTRKEWPEIDVTDLLPSRGTEATRYLAEHGFQKMERVSVRQADPDNSGESIAAEPLSERENSTQMPNEIPAPLPAEASFVDQVPDIPLVSGEAVRVYYSRHTCVDAASYGVGVALDASMSGQVLRATGFIVFVGYDMCG